MLFQTEHATIDALSSKADGLATNSQWAAKQGVADLALAQKMEVKVKALRKDARKVRTCNKTLLPPTSPPLRVFLTNLCQISDALSDLDDSVHRKESKLVDARADVATQQQVPTPPRAAQTNNVSLTQQQQKLESDHLKVSRVRKRLSRYFLERKQAQDRAIAAHAAALTDKTRIAAIVDRLHVLSKEHDRCYYFAAYSLLFSCRLFYACAG